MRDWPFARRDPGLSGATPESGPRVDPELRWTHETISRVFGTPLVVDSNVIVANGSQAPDGPPSLVAIDRESGVRVWGGAKNAFEVRGSPAYVDGCVHVVDLDARRFRVDAGDGSLLANPDRMDAVLGDGSSHVCDGSTLFGNEYGVVALDPNTMTERWRYGDHYVEVPPACWSNLVLAVGRNEIGELVALDPETGERRWTIPVPGRPWSVVVADGIAYALAGRDHDDDGPTVVAVDLDSREILWRRTPGSSPRSLAAVREDVLVVGTSEGTVLALDVESGERIWETRVNEDYQVWSSPTIAGDTVYVGSEDGTVVALDCNSGVEVWRLETPHPVQSNPSVVDGVCYVADNHGTVYALE